MSKRKLATARKHAHSHSRKIAAKPQQAAQAIVRSPKDRRLGAVGVGPTESPRSDNNSPQEALYGENPTAMLNDCKRTMSDNDSEKGIDVSSVTANVQAYQAKLVEMVQANVQFSFEFAQRLAAIRSPVEFPGVIAEFTSKRIAMFRKHSTEMIELRTKRSTG
jgi:Phasin protein